MAVAVALMAALTGLMVPIMPALTRRCGLMMAPTPKL